VNTTVHDPRSDEDLDPRRHVDEERGQRGQRDDDQAGGGEAGRGPAARASRHHPGDEGNRREDLADDEDRRRRSVLGFLGCKQDGAGQVTSA
jgi:hypothetical protein